MRSSCEVRAGARRVVSLLAPVALLLVPVTVRGQGWIEPRPGVMPVDWGVEKVRTSVSVRVTDRVALVEVEEWFRNRGGGLGEGDYVYPLPGEAVFTNYSLYQGEQELRGEMLDAARARDIYETIVRSKRDPALIELVGKSMLRARVFPIEPGQTRRITLRYTQVLERAGDALQFRYAAGARHIGTQPMPVPVPMPRPMPDRRPQQFPERDGGMPVQREPAPLTFTMIVEDAGRFRDAFSPTNQVRVQRERDRMTIRPQDELDGDFAVFLPFATRAVGLTVATHRPIGEDGYFMLTLSPAAVAESRVPRDLTVVVDVSGSMSGEKMDQARRALHQLVGTLGEADRVRLIAFSNRVRPWRSDWTRATRAELAEARRWIDDLRAEGGTDIHAALESAFAFSSPESRLPIVVFMTDGLPTNGETRPERIVAMAESRRGRARIFAFGVGFDVNTYLLDLLSAAARGTTQYVRPSDDVEEAVAALAAKVRHPVLTDLALERATGARITEVYPRDLPDLFAGEELVLFGRYEGAGQGEIAVTGRRNQQAERYRTEVRFPGERTENAYIAQLWAARKLGDLDRRIRAAQADNARPQQVQELIEELRQTALRYGLLSEYTAYLVQEPGMVVAADGALRLQSAPAAPAPPPVASTGQGAVLRAEESRRAREASSMADMQAAQKMHSERLGLREIVVTGNTGGTRTARVIAGRTFTLRDGVWTDARHTDQQRVIAIEPYSAAYFALVRALPELGMVLREVDRVLVAGRTVSIAVRPGGSSTLPDAQVRRVVGEFR